MAKFERCFIQIFSFKIFRLNYFSPIKFHLCPTLVHKVPKCTHKTQKFNPRSTMVQTWMARQKNGRNLTCD